MQDRLWATALSKIREARRQRHKPGEPKGWLAARAVGSDDHHELIKELLEALDRRGLSVEAGQLANLIRVERELVDALSVVRRLIELLANGGLME